MPWVPVHVQPVEWFVAFHRTSPTWWIQRFLPGRWKHVSCFAVIPGRDLWLFVDFALDGSSIIIVPDSQTAMVNAYIDAMSRDALVLRYRPPAMPPSKWRPLSVCTTNVANLIGTRSGALRASRLLKHLIAEGATIVSGAGHGRAEKSAAGTDEASAAAAGDPR